MQHQTKTVKLSDHVEQHALLWTMGTGKTIATWSILANLLHQGKIKNGLIVCPIQVIGAWEDDRKRFGEKTQELLSAIKIINYEKLHRRKEAYAADWDAIVVDESHMISNRKSLRFKTLGIMVRKEQYRFILSGTPIGNARMEDYFSQFKFLLGEEFPFKSYKSFLDAYFSYDLSESRATGARFYDRVYCNRIDELLRWIAPYSSRYDKSVLSDLLEPLPPTVHKVELSDKNLAIYKQLKKSKVIISDDGSIVADRALTLLIRLRQLSSHIFSAEEGYVEIIREKDKLTPKIQALADILRSKNIIDDDNISTKQGSKIVIFVDWVESMEQITRFLRSAGVKYEQMGNGVTGHEHWQNFQADDNIKVFVGNYRSISLGVQLFSADTAIFFEPTLSSQQDTQARSRIHRKGQKGICSYIYLIAKGTVEEEIYNRLKHFEDFFNKMFLNYLKLE